MAAALSILLIWLAAPGAQQPAATPAPTPPKPMVPVAVTSVIANPDAYVGQQLSLTAAVERILTPSAFLVDQDKAKSTGKDLLVLTPRLYGAVEPNTYITVIGELVRFDPVTLAATLKGKRPIDVAPDLAARFRGQPVVLATAVIDPGFVDLTKRLPPPMTADEEAFSRIMRRVGPASAALRKAIEALNANLAAKNTAALKQAFTEAEAFWKARAGADAAEWTRTALKHLEAIESSAAMANWGTVKAAAASLNETCQTCHDAYRERFDDESYRFKTRPK